MLNIDETATYGASVVLREATSGSQRPTNSATRRARAVRRRVGGNGTSTRVAARMRVTRTVEQDEDGFWSARSQARQDAAAFAEGLTEEAALDNLRAGLATLLSVTGPRS
jgi:hypothetical protein